MENTTFPNCLPGNQVDLHKHTNKYVYFKQNFVPSETKPTIMSSKVLVNPHFNKKVFLNPNYRPTNIPPISQTQIHFNPNMKTVMHVPKENGYNAIHINPNKKITHVHKESSSNKIHINPNKQIINVPKDTSSNMIHVNPKILKNLAGSNENSSTKTNYLKPQPLKHPVTFSSKTKLIRTPVKEQTMEATKRIRRSSLYSKFKIVKSGVKEQSTEATKIRRTSLYSKFKIVKSGVKEQSTEATKIRRTSLYSKFKIVKSGVNKVKDVTPKNKLLFSSKYKLKRSANKSLTPQSKSKNRFKLDNRKRHSNSESKSKFLFVNKYIRISDIAKKVPLRTSRGLVNISGIIYKNSPNRLLRTSVQKGKNTQVKQVKAQKENKFKIVRALPTKLNVDPKKMEKKIITRYTSKKKMSPEKLKKCNIPCPYYRKFGKCKGKEMGKCPRKHDPDQIALCTKFLQGACIDSKCLLSHNVSPEKMPTCKYYLEGSCSKDNCPYLHVRISPKADICRDFLEGFCRKASECDKRHQFLCPDYEKKGDCLKPRCSFPHGRMVRKYSVFNKHKFAKKSSTDIKENATSTSNRHPVIGDNKNEENIESEIVGNTRYYSDKNIENEKSSVERSGSEKDPNVQIDFRVRPKLGKLPSFISFE